MSKPLSTQYPRPTYGRDKISALFTDVIHDNVDGEINAIAEKVALVDDDIVLIEDSESTYAKKKAKLSNMLGEDSYFPAGW